MIHFEEANAELRKLYESAKKMDIMYEEEMVATFRLTSNRWFFSKKMK